MSQTKEKKPVWYMTKIQALESEIEVLKAGSPFEIVSPYAFDGTDLEQVTAVTISGIVRYCGPQGFRKLLATLPIPGARLLIRMQAEMAMKPGYIQVPQSEYDGKDFWQVSQSCMG